LTSLNIWTPFSLLIIPDGVNSPSDESVLWKGKIEDIRRDERRNLFWYAIRWYYNAEQSQDLRVKGGSAFQPAEVCGPHELIDTNHFDVLSEENVVKEFDVKKLTDDADQEFIGAGEFYTRATYDIKRTSFKFSTSACPSCKKHQVTESKKTAQIQHYCPSCIKWYHRDCLHDGSDGDADTLLEHVISPDSVGPARKTARKSLNGSKSPLKMRLGTSEAAQTLRRIAGAQIIRGAEYGVSGYVKAISRARDVVKGIQIGDIQLEDIFLEDELGEAVLKASKKWPKTFEVYKCPSCQTWV